MDQNVVLEYITSFFDGEFYGIKYHQFLMAFLILVATFFVRRIAVRWVINTFTRLTAKTETEIDDALVEALKPPIQMGVLIYGIILALGVLPLAKEPLDIDWFVGRASEMAILFIMVWAVWRVLSVLDSLFKTKIDDPNHWLDSSLAQIIGAALRTLLVITGAIVVAQNLGYTVSGLVASLGIGGVAVAMASKDAIANMFGSMMILVDKPFQVGDWVKGSGFEGVVEDIGLRSTRIRTFGKTMEVIPNNVMANVQVENVDSRKDEGLDVRRIKMTIGVTYATTRDQMEKVLQGIKDILKEDEGVDQRMTILVRFTDFAPSSLDIFIYYFADSADWDYYLSVRERVNIKIMKLLEDLGVGMAFPSQSLYIEQLPENMMNPSPE